MPKGKDGPANPLNPYQCFVRCVRDEQKRTNPTISVQLRHFSQHCAPAWKNFTKQQKQPFVRMAKEDLERYRREKRHWLNSLPSSSSPKAPKRFLVPFFWFSKVHRTAVRTKLAKKCAPGLQEETVKELSRMWNELNSTERIPYLELYQRDRARYVEEMKDYRRLMQTAESTD